MGIFKEIRNHCLIRELSRELNTDVLLFGFDGFTYFGNLQAIDDCRIAVLNPAIEAETSNVEILTPGGDVHEVKFIRVDLWQIVAKGTSIVTDPLVCSQGAPFPLADQVIDGVREEEEAVERQESHNLICQLDRMIGDDVVIATLGGFLFEGVLSEVEDRLAILSVDDIFVPGTSSAISSSDVRTVVVNLEALTSVGSTACKC
ncbi:MAG TPA: hypothetical protein PKA10_20045 [Selenomonadales bacterium]|nr:hypothetical protein [Selenomonadales bacterium]